MQPAFSKALGDYSPLILNVDDNEAGRYAKTRILQSAGFTVIDADCGADALVLVKERNPDLVLLDVNLPDINGIVVCSEIKADPASVMVLVLQTSAAFTDKDARLKGLAGGADGYLVEPVEADELVVHVTALLRLRITQYKLKQSEERNRALFESMDQGFCIIEMVFDASGKSVDYRYIETNSQFEEHSGLVGVGDVVGKKASEIKSTIDQYWYDQLGYVATSRKAVRFEREAVGRWFDVHATPIGDADKNRVAIRFRDISSRKHTEELLQRHAARQSFELELSDRLRPLRTPDEITTAASEMLGRRLNASRACYAEVDSSQRTFFIRQHWASAGMTSMAGEVRTLDDFGPDIIAALRAGETVVVDDIALDARAASFAEAYAKIGVRAHIAMPLLKSGRLIAILAIHSAEARQWSEQDIETIKDTLARTWAAVENGHAQVELQIQRDRSQSVFDGMAEGFALLDHNWNLIEVNEAGSQLTKIPRSELIGRNQWEAVPELVGTPAEALYKRVRASGQHETLEQHHTFPDGTTAWLEIRVFPIKHAQLAIFFRDITHRKKIEQELLEADRRKDEFLAMLAHELRNPLAPIGAAATLLEIAALDESRVRQTSEIINRQVSHMTNLINDLLDVSRVTRGLVKLESSVLDIGHVIADAVEQVTPLNRVKLHHLAVHLSPEMIMVRGDRKRLVQVLANLLDNAAKYSPEGGSIEVRTIAQPSQVLIKVTDNGIGMAPDMVARAFELFVQAERTPDRSAGGLGLGLALVKSLVELQGGTVSCASDGVGKGTTFTVRLPRLLDPEKHPDQRDQDNSVLKTLRPLRIMVVDDNVDAASMLQMVLEAMGHHVSVEHGSRRALEQARSETPDVCLLDIGLPDIDGNELAQRLRAEPGTAKSVLIAITGYGQESDRSRSLAAGFDHHLVKPFDAKELFSILARIDKA